MTVAAQVRPGQAGVTVSLLQPDDFDAWRDNARTLVQNGIPPDAVTWLEPGRAGGLFAQDKPPPPPVPVAGAVRASKIFVDRARAAVCHADPDRFAALYRVLWRLQANVRIMEDKADPDVRRVDEMARGVRRDVHKMRAFLRFRRVPDGDEEAAERYVAWFEPEHHILRLNAGFFVRRFNTIRWSILSPQGSLHWDGVVLEEGPPASRNDAPAEDQTEDLWRTYYASTFNPARLKIGAMLKEMPRKYWRNMPETALIPNLIANAQARESTMITAGTLDFGQRPETLASVDEAIHACRRCPIGGLDNTAVMGEGPQSASLMIVGEQPGDQEDHAGRPFVGPAGQVLNEYLAKTGIDRRAAYITNAVKHFKYTVQGKRRLHQSPSAREIDICRWWVETERSLVQPKLILALGASAARAMLGKTVSVSKARGMAHALGDGGELWVTVHPSYLLRLDGPARAEQERLFEADLAAVAARLAEL